MKRRQIQTVSGVLAASALLALGVFATSSADSDPAASASAAPSAAAAAGFERGKPAIRSMSVLEFSPDGVLFVGDAKAGAVWALRVPDERPADMSKPTSILDIEKKIGDLLGVPAAEVMIHDLAVHPVTKNMYLSASRGRAAWKSRWQLPNDIADATILLRFSMGRDFEAISLEDVEYQRAEIPNPVAPDKMHRWKEDTSQRTEAITDLVFHDGKLYVAGLSNEEFASTFWSIPFPFDGGPEAASVEIFHGAHGKYETHSPIRTFVPYELNGKEHILAAYLCTPLVVFPLDALEKGGHVKGKTVAEFGSGNYPMDMVVYRKGEGKDAKPRVLLANSALPLLSFDPEQIPKQKAITEEPPSYTYGLPYEPRAASGVQHLAALDDDWIAAVARQPNGELVLTLLPTVRL